MPKSNLSYTQLFRHKFNRLVSISLFLLTLTIVLSWSWILPSYTQTPTPNIKSREVIIQKIKESAKRHVENEQKMDSQLIIEIYGENSVGLTKLEITEIYEVEYEKVKDEIDSNFWKKIKDDFFYGLPWFAAIAFFILFLFKEAIQGWGTDFIKTIGNWLYNQISGIELFWNFSLKRYKKGLINKHEQLKIPFRPNRPLSLQEIYVDLQFLEKANNEPINFSEIKKYNRLAIKGQPGAGKTLLLKYLVLSWAREKLKTSSNEYVPILLELYRLNEVEISALNMEVLKQKLVEALDRDDFPKANSFVEQSLEKGKLFLLFDGLDEVKSLIRSQVVQAINDLLDKYDKCRAIITCRAAVYRNDFAESVEKTLDIKEFSDRQMRLFLEAWKSEMPPEKSIDQLIQTLRDRPLIMELARNPLMLTIVAHLYTQPAFVLPQSRSDFYQESTHILLNQWQNNFNQYKESAHKRRVLQHLALFAQDNASKQQKNDLSLDYQIVLEQIQKVLPDLNLNPETDTQPILKEIVERSGLLLEVERGDKYQFAHLTLQEYFAATALRDKENELIERFKNDPERWRETIKLWCGFAGNSTNLIEVIYQEDSLTAFECLADAQEVSPILAEGIIEEFKQKLVEANSDENLARAFGAVASDVRERGRGKVVFEFLENALNYSESLEVRQASVKALSKTNLPQAADILFMYYEDINLVDARLALINMGDIAVSLLKGLAEKGSEMAMRDLVKIGTPYSRETLNDLLYHSDENIQRLAALNIAEFTSLNN
ncbi:MAG: NACHT domain-containing protein [Okeania sp. SIO3B5]|uniref:NACHT domain-containing protein n=1 Tax=Okeania sp. SIO3B5 TaxID=2607811 RepID=UPI00140072BB|nr:NACHT domain-containing protein [Okeania sp. SIO3B5]NEO51647.1 NACHT domain-containing protein [Okeania sp. SIO3B5]